MEKIALQSESHNKGGCQAYFAEHRTLFIEEFCRRLMNVGLLFVLVLEK